MNNDDWSEYESAAEWCANHGVKGRIGDPLPAMLSGRAILLINEDPESFEARVRDYAYARAMNMHDHCES